MFNSKYGTYLSCYTCLNKLKVSKCKKCDIKITNKYENCYKCYNKKLSPEK